MLAVVLVVAVLGIGFGVSFVREGSLVVPSLDIGLEVAVEDVIGFGVSPIVGLAPHFYFPVRECELLLM